MWWALRGSTGVGSPPQAGHLDQKRCKVSARETVVEERMAEPVTPAFNYCSYLSLPGNQFNCNSAGAVP